MKSFLNTILFCFIVVFIVSGNVIKNGKIGEIQQIGGKPNNKACKELQNYYHTKPNIGITIFVIELSDQTSAEDLIQALNTINVMTWLSQKSILLVNFLQYNYVSRTKVLHKSATLASIQSLVEKYRKKGSSSLPDQQQQQTKKRIDIVSPEVLHLIKPDQDLVVHYITNLNSNERKKTGCRLSPGIMNKRIVAFNYVVGTQQPQINEDGYRAVYDYPTMKDLYDNVKYTSDLHEKIASKKNDEINTLKNGNFPKN